MTPVMWLCLTALGTKATLALPLIRVLLGATMAGSILTMSTSPSPFSSLSVFPCSKETQRLSRAHSGSLVRPAGLCEEATVRDYKAPLAGGNVILSVCFRGRNDPESQYLVMNHPAWQHRDGNEAHIHVDPCFIRDTGNEFWILTVIGFIPSSSLE